jgi:TRAP-type mannitol/chloroaromatic compound transport system permease large subunit
MSIELITVILFGAIIFFLCLGLPLAFVLGGVGVVGCYFLWGDRGLFMIASQAWGAMNKFTLLAIPLFIFMAMILERAGVADDLYTMMHRWMGPLRGGLAIGTVIICTVFAAMAGISGAATVSMGVIALPAMLKRGYHKTIAMGCISGGGALGILIPPSVPMILYATLTGESIGGMFAGGIMPGLLLAVLFVLYIGSGVSSSPRWGRPCHPRKGSPGRKSCVPQGRGSTHPDHHHGAGFDLLRGLHRHRGRGPGISRGDHLGDGLQEADLDPGPGGLLPDSGPDGHDRVDPDRGLLFYLCLHRHGAHELMEHILLSIPGGKYAILISMQLVFFVLGCILDPVGIIMICTPVFVPVIKAWDSIPCGSASCLS